jgi:hypothetical protein
MAAKKILKMFVICGLLAMMLLAVYVSSAAFESASAVAPAADRYAGSDWIERHPAALPAADRYAGSDWIERHPAANRYAGSDWIERHPVDGKL